MSIVLDMLIDDGNKHRTNRKILFNPTFSLLGAGIAPHSKKQSICHIILSIPV